MSLYHETKTLWNPKVNGTNSVFSCRSSENEYFVSALYNISDAEKYMKIKEKHEEKIKSENKLGLCFFDR